MRPLRTCRRHVSAVSSGGSSACAQSKRTPRQRPCGALLYSYRLGIVSNLSSDCAPAGTHQAHFERPHAPNPHAHEQARALFKPRALLRRHGAQCCGRNSLPLAHAIVRHDNVYAIPPALALRVSLSRMRSAYRRLAPEQQQLLCRGQLLLVHAYAAALAVVNPLAQLALTRQHALRVDTRLHVNARTLHANRLA